MSQAYFIIGFQQCVISTVTFLICTRRNNGIKVSHIEIFIASKLITNGHFKQYKQILFRIPQ